MSQKTGVVIEGVDYGARLPRGRHGLPEGVVVANQRNRMLAAATALFGERGYASLVVSDVIERAGVSRATFYKQFEDKHECVLAAQRRACDSLHRLIASACASQPEWPRGVEASVEAALEFAALSPGGARLVLASSYATSEPRMAADGLAVQQQLVTLLESGVERWPSAEAPSGMAGQAAVGAAMSIVGTFLSAGDVDALPGLRPELVQILLAPYLGSEASARAAKATAG